LLLSVPEPLTVYVVFKFESYTDCSGMLNLAPLTVPFNEKVEPAPVLLFITTDEEEEPDVIEIVSGSL